MNARAKRSVQAVRLWIRQQRIVYSNAKRFEGAYKAAARGAETLAQLDRQQHEAMSKNIIAEEKRLMKATDKQFIRDMRLWLRQECVICNDSKRMEEMDKSSKKDAETLADLNRQQCEIISKNIIAEEKRLARFILHQEKAQLSPAS